MWHVGGHVGLWAGERASVWDLAGAAISTPGVGLLTMWAAVGGAAGLVVWLPPENLELATYEG